MNFIEKMTEGNQLFIKSCIQEGRELLTQSLLQKKSHIALSLEQALTADTAVYRLLERYSEYVKRDILCLAGCKVRWRLCKVVLDSKESLEKVRIWVPALQMFEAMFSSLFLLEVLSGKIVLGDDERHLGTIAEEMYMNITERDAARIMRTHENLLVQPVPLIPDSVEDDYRYLPIGKTHH